MPDGQSLRARLLIAEVSPGDIDRSRLTACQRDAAAGTYAKAMAGFIHWLAPQYDVIRARWRQEVADLRDKAAAPSQAMRTPSIVADLFIGLRYFLAYAVDTRAITTDTAEVLRERCWRLLCQAADTQTAQQQANEPTGQFLRLLVGVLASFRAHIAGPDGQEPVETPDAWGWRRDPAGRWQPEGRRIGWLDGEDLYLEPEAAYAEAQHLVGQQGDALAVSCLTLRKRLKDMGLLKTTDQRRGKLTIRRTLAGARRDVLHLGAACLYTPEDTGPSGPKIEHTQENGPISRAGFLPRIPEAALEMAQKNAENGPLGRLGRSDGGVYEAADEKVGADRPLYVLLPCGRSDRVPTLAAAPMEATHWCRQGDKEWKPLNGDR